MIDPRGVPADQAEIISEFNSSLGGLESYVRAFDAAAELLASSTTQSRIERDAARARGEVGLNRRLIMFREWPFIAARDGAHTIFHFGKTLGIIDYLINRTPFLAEHTLPEKRREARKYFTANFPSNEHFRNAVAHMAENFFDPKRREQNAIVEPISDQFVGAMPAFQYILTGSTVTVAKAGEPLTYELTYETREKLQRVCDLMYEAIAPCLVASRKWREEKFKAPPAGGGERG